MDRIGVIGLGRMGSAIAARFAAQGASVRGWTRSGLTEARAEELGIARAETLDQLVAASDILVTSLFDDTAAAEVLDTLLTSCDLQGRLIVETSTVIPALLTDRIAAIRSKGADAVDAPISGGPEMVQAGTCGIFIGGSDAAASRASAALSALSGRIFHVGPLGTGLVMKTINNAMMQTYAAGLREMLPVAKRAGLSLEMALTILCGGPAGMPMVRDRLPKILGADPVVGFPMSAVVKDNDVFLSVVESFGLSAPILAIAGEMQRASVADGLGDADTGHAIAAAYANG